MLSDHVARFVPPYADRFTSCWELFALTESQIRQQQAENLGAPINQWADVNREEAIRVMELHTRHARQIWRDLFDARGFDVTAFAHLEPFTDEEQAEIRILFGPYATKSWTGLSPYQLHKEVRDSWVNDNERVLLDHVFSVSLRYANLRLHSTSTSMIRPKETTEAALLYDAGESDEDIAVALLISFWALTHTLRHLLAEPLRGELMAFYYERMPTFFRS